MMVVRGVRGAITVDENSKEEIVHRTEELLRAIVTVNKIQTNDIASAIFTVTDDLNAEFPAVAARKLGWIHIPLLCSREIPVPGSLGMCVRVLLHINTDKNPEEIVHVYLRDARKLRPDIGTPEQDKYYVSDSQT
ncbi:MAG: chorismate mutase [Spirochaetes bacterium]|nr:chorismate mutase [Spirochaetota bacterium]NMB64520.1 chorismate mutase [Spirochaetota bacterium]HOJ29971.1 chorismate mutase [Spirochaetota bacterium]HOM10785.1 chorismate mutase [Spirochaetota bacterium]HPP50666.1 chorismate mutase [Spirochaetota bacterium]